ncbi:MAG: hypothetical protein ACRDQU_19970 [Pseudonocardiaceae bacterium]
MPASRCWVHQESPVERFDAATVLGQGEIVLLGPRSDMVDQLGLGSEAIYSSPP